ncbi:uncharacterized protein [Oryctolagus cuniculus]|uniref:uncharacterized protein n=1 Tax=Oryctolagus cuniculus TaxID=9986 RepID=UPI00387A29F6
MAQVGGGRRRRRGKTAASIPATPHRRLLRRTSQGYTHTVPTYLCFLADLRHLRPPPPLPSSPLPPMNLAATPTTSNATPTLRTLAPTPTPTPYTTLQRRRCHRCSVSERQRQSVLYSVGVSVGVGVSVRSVGVSVGASVRSVGVAFDVVGVAAKFISGSGEEGSGGGGLRSRRSARKQRPEASVFAGNGCSGSEPGSQEAAAVVWASRGTWCSGWRRLVTVLPYQGEILPSGPGCVLAPQHIRGATRRAHQPEGAAPPARMKAAVFSLSPWSAAHREPGTACACFSPCRAVHLGAFLLSISDVCMDQPNRFLSPDVVSPSAKHPCIVMPSATRLPEAKPVLSPPPGTSEPSAAQKQSLLTSGNGKTFQK